MTKFLWTDTIGGNTWDASALRLWASDWYEEVGADDLELIDPLQGIGQLWDVATISGLNMRDTSSFGFMVDATAVRG